MNLLKNIISEVYAADIIGQINPPVANYSNINFVTPFISAIIKFIMIIGGLFTFWQIITGGFGLITSGADKAKITEAQNKIIMAILGLVIMVASFVIIAIISQLLFGDFMFILNPTIETV